MTKLLALIVEDDKRLAEIFSLALQKEFEIKVISDGTTALALLAELIPAVVVLDLHLPHISGEKILQKIRSYEHLAKTRVIVATADAQKADQLREIADLVLLKPISPNQLRELAMRLRPPDTVID